MLAVQQGAAYMSEEDTMIRRAVLVIVFLVVFAAAPCGIVLAQNDPNMGMQNGWSVLDEHTEQCEEVSSVRIAFLVDGTAVTGDVDGPRYKSIRCERVEYQTQQGNIIVIEQMVSAKCGMTNLIVTVSHVNLDHPWGEAYVAYPCYAAPDMLPYGEPLIPFFSFGEGCYDNGGYEFRVLLDARPPFGDEWVTPYVTKQPANCWPNAKG